MSELPQSLLPGKSLTLAADYETPPPDIDEFLDSEEYLGHIGPMIYPFWREKLRELFPNPYYSPYIEVAITGSIGGGKTWFCCVSILYELCLFLHRKDPYKAFGFMPGQPIFIALCNNTLSLSHDVQLETFNNMIKSSPYFQKQQAKYAAMPHAKPSKGAMALNLPNNIEMLAGSLSRHAVGRAVISAMMSELNIQNREGGKQAINTYLELKNRLYSRFHRKEGLCPPGRLYLDSSRKDITGVLEQYIAALRNKPEVMIIEAPWWEFTRGSADRDVITGQPTFKVYKGSSTKDPFVLKGTPDEEGVSEALCIDVPEALRVHFERDPVTGLRDWAGVATGTTGTFITSERAIEQCAQLINPCTKNIVMLDMVDTNDILINYIDLSGLSKDFVYFVHGDLGKSKDKVGLAFTRLMGRTNIEHFDRDKATNILLQDNLYQTDLIICIKNKPNQEVPFAKIEAVFIDLKRRGIEIGGISFDQAYSSDLIQRLKAYNFNAKELSVDRTRGPYDHLRQLILEDRIVYPNHPVLVRELKELVDLETKIEHPEETPLNNKDEDNRPSKDCADALAGSVWLCAESNRTGSKTFIQMEQFGKAIRAIQEKPLTLEEKKQRFINKNSNRSKGIFTRL